MRVYFTCPVSVMNGAMYPAALERCRQLMPGAEILGVGGLYKSALDWRLNWHQNLDSCDQLVVLTDSQHWLGRGAYSEVTEALADGKDVFVLGNEFAGKSPQLVCTGLLTPWGACDVVERNPDDWTRHACVRTKASVAAESQLVTLTRDESLALLHELDSTEQCPPALVALHARLVDWHSATKGTGK